MFAQRGCIYLLVFLAPFFHAVIGSPTQVPLSTEQPEQDGPDNSNLILASLHALMKTWPQAFAPNGHAVVPATIKPGTLLYHAGSREPKGTEWMAFSAEHSYIFGGGLKAGSPYHFAQNMYTYTATRPLRALYFDGFSASKQGGGVLDLQNIIVYGKADGGERGGDYGDIERGELLCDWGKKYGIEGFIREEATYELVWCNFDTGVRLIGINEIVIPSADISESKPHNLPRGSGRQKQLVGGWEPIDIEPWMTPYSHYNGWSMYHAAAWHHTVHDSHVTLHSSYLVTLYDPVYSSLAANNKLPFHKHGLVDISPEDQSAFLDELDHAIKARNNDPEGNGSGVDWSSIAQTLVERNGDRISEMRKLLDDVAPGSNVTKVVSQVRLVAFALLMPYIDHAAMFAPNITVIARASALKQSERQCVLAFTGHIDTPYYCLTPQERRLKRAVEGVLKRICKVSTGVLGESLDFLEAVAHNMDGDLNTLALSKIRRWRSDITDLMDWLGWTMWRRCPRACDWDEQCFVHMWPIGLSPDRPMYPGFPGSPENGSLTPRCIKTKDMHMELS